MRPEAANHKPTPTLFVVDASKRSNPFHVHNLIACPREGELDTAPLRKC